MCWRSTKYWTNIWRKSLEDREASILEGWVETGDADVERVLQARKIGCFCDGGGREGGGGGRERERGGGRGREEGREGWRREGGESEGGKKEEEGKKGVVSKVTCLNGLLPTRRQYWEA